MGSSAAELKVNLRSAVSVEEKACQLLQRALPCPPTPERGRQVPGAVRCTHVPQAKNKMDQTQLIWYWRDQRMAAESQGAKTPPG